MRICSSGVLFTETVASHEHGALFRDTMQNRRAVGFGSCCVFSVFSMQKYHDEGDNVSFVRPHYCGVLFLHIIAHGFFQELGRADF